MNRKAFTLIELLVVIAIIALLLAIMMPALGIVKQKAQGVVCMARLKNISIAYYTYSGENSDKLAGGWTLFEPTQFVTVNGQKKVISSWACNPQTENGVSKSIDSPNHDSVKTEKVIGIKKGVLWSYIKDEDAYHCVGDQRYKRPPDDTNYKGEGGWRSYSIPIGLNGGSPGTRWMYTRLSQIRQPSKLYAFVEEADPRGYNVNAWSLPVTGDQWTDPISIWHNEKSALGFVDGHVEMHSWKDKTTLEMGWNQIIHQQVDPAVDGEIEDLRYMQEHYPYKR